MSILPDEILSEILSPALKVSDDLFSDISEVSPLADYSPSTSAYLVVCKDWLHVATPLLYNVVVLRSKAQANALEKVLHSNLQFGHFIKKLRVEEGYGMAMDATLKSALNITDIVLSLSIWSSDNTQGLCQGLPLIDPHRVIVMAPVLDKPLKNKHLAALMAALFSCIRTWEKLTIFGFPYSDKDLHPISTKRAFKLAEALAQSPTIHTVLLPFMDMYRIPEFFTPLRKIPSLQFLQFRGPRSQDAEVAINSDRHLKALMRYPTQDFEDKTSSLALAVPDITPTLNPSFSPLKSASDETRDTLWRRALFFAIYVEELQCPTFPRSPTVSHPSRLPILLVSKYFNYGGVPSIARQLQYRPELGSFIRYIFIRGDHFPKDAMLTILSSAPNMQKIRGRGSEFQTHAKISAKGFEVALPISTSAFAHLTELRVLLLDFYGVTLFTSDPSSRIALYTLRLPGYIPIPELSNVIKLLDMHVGRLLRLTLRYENMGRFSYTIFARALSRSSFLGCLCDIADLTCKTPHTSLIKIIASDLLGKPEENNFDMFPALRAIQLRWHRWPTNERDISKSDVVPVAETLSQKNITLTDANGKQWVPRVKSSAVRRIR
ncbi:hypothetical protein DFH09DRAFT_1177514 [Mycena vulgaris]|nr:hypothetical protein DFH09DRAFT_1177514 [Mycena vulgaris]